MKADPETVALILAGILGVLAQIRLGLRRIELYIAAAIERSRRREARRLRGDSSMQSLPPARCAPSPNEFDDDEEDTDIHHLVELERQHRRSRRDTDRRRRRAGERPPRPGTHSDKPYED